MLKKLLTVITLTSMLLFGAESTTLMFYSGANLAYTCEAPSVQPAYYWSRNNSTLTSIADSSNTSTLTFSAAHGLAKNNKVTISGATIATALNGDYIIQTVGSSTTATVTTSGVADATYTESSLRVSTTAPRTTAAIWKVTAFTTTTYLDAVQTEEPIRPFGQICDNRSTTPAQ